MADNSKIQSIDNLRVLATISVIFLHVSASVALRFTPQKLDVWWVGNIVDGAVRFCVPVFLMISGALLLGREISPLEFFKKRTSRILYPFVFWAVLYFIYYWYIQKPANRPTDFEAIIIWAYELAKSGVSYHFWFIYMLLGLYVFVPFAVKQLKMLSRGIQFAILFIWFLLISINSVGLLFYSTNCVLSNYFTSLFGYAGYMLLGFYLFNLEISKKQSILFGAMFFLLGALITIGGTYLTALVENKYAGFYYNFLSVNVLFEALGIFLLFKHVTLKSEALLLIRDAISVNSFGIYFVHVMVLGFLFRAGVWWGMAHSAITIPLIALGTLTISWALIWILKKLPFGKYFAG